MQIMIQKIISELDSDSGIGPEIYIYIWVFLHIFFNQVMLMQLVWGPHLEQQGTRFLAS